MLQCSLDASLVAFLKRLLNFNVNERSTVAEALCDPFLTSVETSPPHVWWSPPMLIPAAVPLSRSLLPLLPEMGVIEELRLVEGMQGAYWNPGFPSFCEAETGTFHR